LALGALGAGIWVGWALAAPSAVPVPKPRPAIAALPKTPPPHPQTVPLPRKRPEAAIKARAYAEAEMGLRGPVFSSHPSVQVKVQPGTGAFAVAPTSETSAADIAALKQVLEAAGKGRDGDADKAEARIKDPVARKLAEYVILRSNDTKPGFQRYANFIKANPAWPHISLFRRRAENALWNDGIEDATVLGFFAGHQPTTAKGRFALAHALLAKGDKAGAVALVRYAWRYEDCTDAVESKVLAMFGSMLTPMDHKVRMEQRFYHHDIEAGLRAAHRLGGNDLAIAHAWAAVLKNASTAKARLDAVPKSARSDPGYIFARARWLRHKDEYETAAREILAAPHEASPLIDSDAWWRERRILVRDLLDKHDPKTAYQIAVVAVTPSRNVYRVDKYFTAGWIALRFLHDPKTAASLFAEIPQGTKNPHALSRGEYWLGRAADAMGQKQKAQAFYEKAAQYTVTYYGQLARARLGLHDLGLRGPPKFSAEQRRTLARLEVVRAAKLLYALKERTLLASMYASLGESGRDVAGLSELAAVAGQHNDPRAMVLLAEAAVRRGLPLDYYAYPVAGLPEYKPIAPPVGRAVAYSIARQESHFHQNVVSGAHAMGLMQVTPEAGRDTARRYKVHYSRQRLLTDPAYNMQMGTAELSHLLGYFNGNDLLSFAAYNAGLGRIRQWMDVYGDPRDPKVDPVDWVERLPYSETRNYVQRIMENLEIYRARFGGNGKLTIEADLTRGK
ncbi:MAG TPA: transglycosylase SLT domain-containing protein, partial [Pseudolabrys sp.]|nr:transglycosylase SLT domain-containing protein [Pseudolabrys sp.]